MNFKNYCYSVIFSVCDSIGYRKRRVKSILALIQQFKSNPSDQGLLASIEQAAKSRHVFSRCYALHELGSLGDSARTAVPTIMKGLFSSDHFVRESAAHSLLKMAKLGNAVTRQCIAAEKQDLLRVFEDHSNEGTARYIVLTLDALGEEHNLQSPF